MGLKKETGAVIFVWKVREKDLDGKLTRVRGDRTLPEVYANSNKERARYPAAVLERPPRVYPQRREAKLS